MNNFTDKLIEEFNDDSSVINLTKSGVYKLTNMVDLHQYHNSYADYMTFINNLKQSAPQYPVEEIDRAKNEEEQFIKTANKSISNRADIIKATASGYIVDITYNVDKKVTLVLPNFYFITKYEPVPYVNTFNPDYSVENFVYNFNNINTTDLLYSAVKFHESNIPLRYNTQAHGPKRVVTFYKTYLYEGLLQEKYRDIQLTKITNQDCLKKGPGDNKPDFSYIENGETRYAEAKIDLSFDAAISACKAVNMTPFPNRLYILKNNSKLYIYDINESMNIVSEQVDVIQMPNLPSLPETW